MPASVTVHSYRFGKGAGQHSAARGPLGGYQTLNKKFQNMNIDMQWRDVVPRTHRITDKSTDAFADMPGQLKNAQAVIESVTSLAENVALTILNGESFPLTFGGDHTQGIGTFKGMVFAEVVKAVIKGEIPVRIGNYGSTFHAKSNTILHALKEAVGEGDIKKVSSELNRLIKDKIISETMLNQFIANVHLVWFDAHGDYNIPSISPSGNAHGMSAAVITGNGDSRLTSILGDWNKIPPTNIHYLAVRDLDKDEEDLMKSTNTNIHYMEEIQRVGLKNVVDNVFNEITAKKIGPKFDTKIHLSFDIDGIDAKYVPATGTPVGTGSTRNSTIGPSLQETLDAFTGISEKVIAIDISESNFRTDRDPEGVTLESVNLVTQALFGSITPEVKYQSYTERAISEGDDKTSFFIASSLS